MPCFRISSRSKQRSPNLRPVWKVLLRTTATFPITYTQFWSTMVQQKVATTTRLSLTGRWTSGGDFLMLTCLLKLKKLLCRSHTVVWMIVKRLHTVSSTSISTASTIWYSSRCLPSWWAKSPRFQTRSEIKSQWITIHSISSRNVIELRRRVRILNNGIIWSASNRIPVFRSWIKLFIHRS